MNSSTAISITSLFISSSLVLVTLFFSYWQKLKLEKETVLDFTFGSCTTGVACKNLNRKFIGIELDDHYFEIGKNRILAD